MPVVLDLSRSEYLRKPIEGADRAARQRMLSTTMRTKYGLDLEEMLFELDEHLEAEKLDEIFALCMKDARPEDLPYLRIGPSRP
jgi:hypothetical protein